MQPGSPHDHDSSPFGPHLSTAPADFPSTEAADSDDHSGWGFSDVPLSAEPSAASASRNGDHGQQDIEPAPEHRPQSAATRMHVHDNGNAADAAQHEGSKRSKQPKGVSRGKDKLAEENAQLRAELQEVKEVSQPFLGLPMLCLLVCGRQARVSMC